MNKYTTIAEEWIEEKKGLYIGEFAKGFNIGVRSLANELERQSWPEKVEKIEKLKCIYSETEKPPRCDKNAEYIYLGKSYCSEHLEIRANDAKNLLISTNSK